MDITSIIPEKILNGPEFFQNKSKLFKCFICTIGTLIFTISVFVIGVSIGYMYCYFEYGAGFRTTADIIQATQLEIIQMPLLKHGNFQNRTINGALGSSIMISRILKIVRGYPDVDVCMSSPNGESCPDLLQYK